MRWFGGFSNPTAPPRTPADSGRPWPSVPGVWTAGQWTGPEVRTTCTGRRFVVVIGPCGIAQEDLARLGAFGAPDDVAWRWSGSYTTVEITDEHTKVWTDLGGAWPIYTMSADGGAYWASSSRALAGLTDAGLDLDRLAAWMLAPAVPLLLAGQSAFTGVDLVPAGHRLTVTRDGMIRTNRMWSPRPRSGSARRRLRAELAAAVALRVDAASAPTVDLSGGCDSTALALLAHESAGHGQTVTGVTVYPVGHPAGGDLEYARLAAERSGITHRLMPLDSDHVPYTALSAVPVTDEPAPSTVAHARFSGQLHWMRDALGTDCHLTGDGGDSLLCSPPIMLADLLATGHHRRGLIETIRWARLRRLPVWPLLTSAYRSARTTRAGALASLSVDLFTGARKPTDGDIAWCATELVPPWATYDARSRAVAVASAMTEQADQPPIGLFAATVAAEGIADVGRSARADIQLAEAAGVPLHNPFTDSRVVDAYLSLPLDERPGPADYKPILRDALADLFPAALAARTTKGDFNSDHYHGMRANLNELHALVDGRLAALGLVNPAEFRRTLTMTAAGLPVAFSTVEPAVAAEVWLRALADAPNVAWTPAAATKEAR
ncbi:albusnodin/ikarugamycin family macrolactam cyclase [Actinoalloteichus caeruleus]|uniref:albusnodin/ikarugamycin family macrolactam cyclase n=1 Tax=Actinoalloteichus cyanogriseus TaxID=2893586 RepID=UPI003AAF3C30